MAIRRGQFLWSLIITAIGAKRLAALLLFMLLIFLDRIPVVVIGDESDNNASSKEKNTEPYAKVIITPQNAEVTERRPQNTNRTVFTCPSFDELKYALWRQCPAEVGADLRCVPYLPGDVYSMAALNCATIDDYPTPALNKLDAAEMLELIRQRDAYGRPWCMLSLLYSPECVFSAKVAESFHRVAPLFPKLRVVAVDVSTSGKGTDALISQFGIASTPVMALWENGYPRFRIYDDVSRLDSLLEIIHRRTDLRANKRKPSNDEITPPKNEEEKEEAPRDAYGDVTNQTDAGRDEALARYPGREEFVKQFRYLRDEMGYDWYLLGALALLLTNVAYFIATFPRIQLLVKAYFPERIWTRLT